MARYVLDDVHPGMTLSEPVKNNNGQILLVEGAEITEKNIRSMKMWGIMDISIDDEGERVEADLMEEISPEILKKATKVINDKFIHVDLSSPVMRTLFGRAIKKYAKKIADEANDD